MLNRNRVRCFPPVRALAILVALACLLVGSVVFAETGSATLTVRGNRPALLWLAAEDLLAENISIPEANNRSVHTTVISDGELTVLVRTNYDYWLTITSGRHQAKIFGPNTQLEWQELSRELLPMTAAGEEVALTLEWQADCAVPAATHRSTDADPPRDDKEGRAANGPGSGETGRRCQDSDNHRY